VPVEVQGAGNQAPDFKAGGQVVDVDGPDLWRPRHAVVRRPDECNAILHSDAVAKLVIRRSIRGHDLVELLSGGPVKDIGGSGIHATDQCVSRADDDEVAVHIHCMTESVQRYGIRSHVLECLGLAQERSRRNGDCEGRNRD